MASTAIMAAIKTMIAKSVSGNAAPSYTCTSWYASNYSRVANGRAYIGSDGQVYAVNLKRYLGYYLTTAYTDERRTSAGYNAYGACS